MATPVLANPGFSAPFQNKRNSLNPTSFSNKNFKYCKDFFEGVETFIEGGGATGGTDTNINVLVTGNAFGVVHEYFIIGTQTITAPVLTVSGGGGLDVTLDETVDEGTEIIFGAKHSGVARGRLSFTAGTDRAFFAKIRVYLTDVTGVGQLWFGFKKAIAAGATSTYTDYAVLGLNDATGAITAVTRLNDGSAAATDTGEDWADTTAHTLEVRVSTERVASFYLDGLQMRQPPTFTFDDTDVLVPFFRHVHATDINDDCILVGDRTNNYAFECGYLPEFGSAAGV